MPHYLLACVIISSSTTIILNSNMTETNISMICTGPSREYIYFAPHGRASKRFFNNIHPHVKRNHRNVPSRLTHLFDLLVVRFITNQANMKLWSIVLSDYLCARSRNPFTTNVSQNTAY